MLPAHPLFVPGLSAPCCILCFGHYIVVGAKILVGAFMMTSLLGGFGKISVGLLLLLLVAQMAAVSSSWE